MLQRKEAKLQFGNIQKIVSWNLQTSCNFGDERRDGNEAVSYHEREHKELHVSRESGRWVEHLPRDISTFYISRSLPPPKIFLRVSQSGGIGRTRFFNLLHRLLSLARSFFALQNLWIKDRRRYFSGVLLTHYQPVFLRKTPIL